MNETKIRQLLKEHVATYINNIAIELERFRDGWFDGFGFPMFGETSREYHEQVYFQSYLESYTRKLINGILHDICEEESTDKITWPEFEYHGIYNGYTNSECEQEFRFEFIDHDKKIGYRYTSVKLDEIDELLSDDTVKSIAVVLWQTEDDPPGFHYGDSRIRVILLWDLFEELFCELDEEEIRLMYDLFTDQVTQAVTRANSMISLVTLPGFTASYLYKTREETLRDLRKQIHDLSCFFIQHREYKSTEVNSRDLIHLYSLPEYFLAQQMERTFVGLSKHAKSFLTSEYLYRYFRNNPMFDYTPIVSGYLKSIELLLDVICVSYRNHHKIRCEEMKKFTLGNYIHFVKENDSIFREKLRPAKDVIIACLEGYLYESRNNLFHKDHFDTWERVEHIRTNTIFLYVALLGSIDSELFQAYPKILEIMNDDFDHLFQILERQRNTHFTLVIDGTEYSDVEMAKRNCGLFFYSSGRIKNTITFRRLVYDSFETIEISRQKVPTEVWLAEHHNMKSKRIWPPIDEVLQS